MIALPDPFEPASLVLILNPFDKISYCVAVVFSASLKFGNRVVVPWLKGALLVSKICQLYAVVFLKRINRGLKPKYTNGPSAEPLPVYEPNLEYPAISEKQYATIPFVEPLTVASVPKENTDDVGVVLFQNVGWLATALVKFK